LLFLLGSHSLMSILWWPLGLQDLSPRQLALTYSPLENILITN
jgi:hypothetical protein